MSTTYRLAILAFLLLGVSPALAGDRSSYTRLQDWQLEGPILLPPDRMTPTVIADSTLSRPLSPPTPNYFQFNGYDKFGKPTFVNPITGQSRIVPNTQTPPDFKTPRGRVKRTIAARPPGQPATGLSVDGHP